MTFTTCTRSIHHEMTLASIIAIKTLLRQVHESQPTLNEVVAENRKSQISMRVRTIRWGNDMLAALMRADGSVWFVMIYAY